jgi:hypothetical protein
MSQCLMVTNLANKWGLCLTVSVLVVADAAPIDQAIYRNRSLTPVAGSSINTVKIAHQAMCTPLSLGMFQNFKKEYLKKRFLIMYSIIIYIFCSEY